MRRRYPIGEFRKDWTACSKFAVKREQARELLAWKPHPPWINPPGSEDWKRECEARRKQEAAESEAKLNNLNADSAASMARYEADELACLHDLDGQTCKSRA
jgi:hypothetical protein